MTAGIRHCERSAAIHVPGIVIASEARQSSATPTVIASEARQSSVPGTVIASAARQSSATQHRHCERSAETHAPGIVIASEARQSMSCVPIIRIDPAALAPPSETLLGDQGRPRPRPAVGV
jgi:hypothetical protein